jgi:hypothetical protein
MHWFRSRLRLGSCIALLALALQLVLAFGHVHLDGIGGHASARIEALGGTAPAPASNDTPDVADDYCAICALIHFAGALVPTELPPSLPLPVVFARWYPDAAATPELPISTPAYFAARAPPVA